ncbi:F-box domain containing protein [Tanacetum coccineum]
MVKLHYPFECRTDGGIRDIRVIGTFNGIVALVVNDHKDKDIWSKPVNFTSHIILYNPFTGASEIIPDPYSPFYNSKYIYGFGYGATKDDLKIVRFRGLTKPDDNWNTCDVLNLKERLWSTSEILIKDAHFGSDVGTFLNGSLYWFAVNKIVALNVNEMVISEIHLPCERVRTDSHLGTLHGCLSMITRHENYVKRFDMWVMKTDQGVKNSWSKSRLLTLADLKHIYRVEIINLMDDGRILMTGLMEVERNGTTRKEKELIIYDTSKDSYKVLSGRPSHMYGIHINAIQYEESLISPWII